MTPQEDYDGSEAPQKEEDASSVIVPLDKDGEKGNCV